MSEIDDLLHYYQQLFIDFGGEIEGFESDNERWVRGFRAAKRFEQEYSLPRIDYSWSKDKIIHAYETKIEHLRNIEK